MTADKTIAESLVTFALVIDRVVFAYNLVVLRVNDTGKRKGNTLIYTPLLELFRSVFLRSKDDLVEL